MTPPSIEHNFSRVEAEYRRTGRLRSWLALLIPVSSFLAGCANSGPLQTPNPTAPTETGPAIELVVCGGTTKVNVLNLCVVKIDDAHYGNPGVTVWADFSAFGPPYTSKWDMWACGVCGQVYETDFKVRVPGEYQLSFYVRDADGRTATAKSKVIAIQ